MIRVGIGGWSFAPWRGLFYPQKLPAGEELAFASRQVTAIEINATFYRTQSRASFVKWREATPDDFIFAVKAHRAAVNARALSETGETIEHFLASGVTELSDKLGPILWQLPPYRRFHAEELAAFLKLLPKKRGALRLRHALEVRHPSFLDEKFIALLRAENIAAVFVDSADDPAIADATADFVYARLKHARDDRVIGYPAEELDLWARRAREWERGAMPADLPHLAAPATKNVRDVFVFVINGAKRRAPAAAQALIARLRA